MVALGAEDTGDPAYGEKRGTPCAAAPRVTAMLRPEDREPGPHELVNDAGGVIARIDIADRIDWLQADVPWIADGLDRRALAVQLVRLFEGMRVSTADEELTAALVGEGGTVARRGTQLSYDAGAAPPPREWLDRSERDGVRLADYRPIDEEIASAWMAAYPPTHPDHDAALLDVADAVADLRTVRTGTVTGLFSEDASALALGPSGEVLGGIMVTLMRPNPYWDGPWVPDLFVRPDAQRRGIGERLVRYAVAAVAASGEKGLALSVTDGNPARLVYDRVGFVPGISVTSITIPPPVT